MDSFQGLLNKLAKIPDDARVFDITSTAAVHSFGISAQILGELPEKGFPVSRKNGEACFETSDLINLSHHIKQGSRYRIIRRYWPNALAKLDTDKRVGYRLDYLAKCPGHEQAACLFRLLTPDRGYVERRRESRDSGRLYSTEILLESAWPALPEAARALVESFNHLELFYLPRALRTDTDFMLDTGLATCVGVSQLLLAEGNRRGIPVRRAWGLLMMPPFGSIHHWAEIEVGGRHVPIDPLMINALLRWNIIDAYNWNPHRSLGGVLCRLASEESSVITHNGASVAASFPTRYLDNIKYQSGD